MLKYVAFALALEIKYILTKFILQFVLNNKIRFGEVYYYFRCLINGNTITLAVISIFSNPDPILLRESHGTVLSCTGDDSLIVIGISSIQAVVAMIPHQPPGLDEGHFFVVERPGLDIMNLSGFSDDMEDIDNHEEADG